MIYKVITMKKDVGTSKDKFVDDNSISEYAKTAVSALVMENFISGYEDGSFMPKLPATRAMAVKVIYDILKSDNRI